MLFGVWQIFLLRILALIKGAVIVAEDYQGRTIENIQVFKMLLETCLNSEEQPTTPESRIHFGTAEANERRILLNWANPH